MSPGLALGRWFAGGVIALGAAGAVLAIGDFSTPLRMPLVLVFLAVVPALAVVSLLPDLDLLAKLVVAGSAAIVIDTGVAETQIATGTWSPTTSVIAIALISVLLAACRPLVAARAATGRSGD